METIHINDFVLFPLNLFPYFFILFFLPYISLLHLLFLFLYFPVFYVSSSSPFNFWFPLFSYLSQPQTQEHTHITRILELNQEENK